MGDDHMLLFFGLHAVFCFSTNCADRSSVANTTIDQFFIPELHVQVGIGDVSAEASDPCLSQHTINIDFLYEHNLSMLIYIVIVAGSMPDWPKQKFQGGKEPMWSLIKSQRHTQ